MEQPEPGEVAVHHRSIEFEAFDHGDHLLVIGRLRDRRPAVEGRSVVSDVHDMELRITADKATMTITGAEASMATFPHAECPDITPSFAGLVGLSVTRGYTRAVQERFGRVSGCSHLETLAKLTGPVVIQAATSAIAKKIVDGTEEDLRGSSERPWPLNTCHIWAEDGVAMSKLRAGWRPGKGEYPVPLLSEIRRRSATP